MTTDELRAKFEAWIRVNVTDFHYLPADVRRFAEHVFAGAHASRDAEVEALRKDAERYRWLSRKHANPVEKDWYVYGATGPFLSDSIDAAMREEK